MATWGEDDVQQRSTALYHHRTMSSTDFDGHVEVESGYFCEEFSAVTETLQDGKCPWCGAEIEE